MNSSETKILLDNLLERLEYYRTDEAITFYAPYKFELKQRIKKLEKKISKLRIFIAKNPNENIDTTELQSLYSLMSKESYSKEFIEKSKNVISNSTINAGRDIHIGDIHITKTTGFSILFVIAFITVIGLWQKEEIKIALGFDKFFVEDDQDFKIIILPFNEICRDNGKNYDAGYLIERNLINIIQKDSLKIKTIYWKKFDLEGFSDQKADELRKYHNADMILYGTYQTGSCSAEGNQICLNYLTDEKWKLGKTGYNIDKLDYKKGGVDEIKKGKISEKVENIAFFVSVIAQMKNIDHSKYLAKLREILEWDIEESIKGYIYEEIGYLLLNDERVDEALINYQKALISYDSYMAYLDRLGMIAECFLYQKQIDSAYFYYEKGILDFYYELKEGNDTYWKPNQNEVLQSYLEFFDLQSELMKVNKDIKVRELQIEQKYEPLEFDSLLPKEIRQNDKYYFMWKQKMTEHYYNQLSIIIVSFLCKKLKKEEYCKNARNKDYF